MKALLPPCPQPYIGPINNVSVDKITQGGGCFSSPAQVEGVNTGNSQRCVKAATGQTRDS